jgi:EAL domain-containing protein (putative c-di-GMP-specific phosphodiesterase class I)
MSKALEFLIVAEGVDTEGQRLFLSQHQCEEGQGFFFSKPSPANDFESLLVRDIRYQRPIRS